MTLKEAIELSLEVWRYLAEHPEIKRKNCLPKVLYSKIENMRGYCPLCACGFWKKTDKTCPDCPLYFEKDGSLINCDMTGHPYRVWLAAATVKTRKEGAIAMVRLLTVA
jgi:hypothetical protein